jgi:hypothetical protein
MKVGDLYLSLNTQSRKILIYKATHNPCDWPFLTMNAFQQHIAQLMVCFQDYRFARLIIEYWSRAQLIPNKSPIHNVAHLLRVISISPVHFAIYADAKNAEFYFDFFDRPSSIAIDNHLRIPFIYFFEFDPEFFNLLIALLVNTERNRAFESIEEDPIEKTAVFRQFEYNNVLERAFNREFLFWTFAEYFLSLEIPCSFFDQKQFLLISVARLITTIHAEPHIKTVPSFIRLLYFYLL